MEHYSFEDIDIGIVESFEVDITEDKMKAFSQISGDFNQMHVDYKYAIEHGYKGILVYGMLSSLFYSTLVGMYLPGEKCLLNKCAVDYKHPVYIGDKLTVSGRVVDKRVGTRRIMIYGQMINQEGVTVNTADITVSFTS